MPRNKNTGLFPGLKTSRGRLYKFSEVYQLIRDGVSDMHCMSDAYLADELE